jgi:CheY-like chemotaxis protein
VGDAARVEGTARRAATVLVVEDDQDLREIISLTLEARGLTVATASDGAAALAWLRAQDPMPCLVLLDLMMPGMNGFELSATMHADPALTAIPVVVLTGAPLLAQQRRDELHAEVLPKPIELETLVSTVRRFCRTPSVNPENP